MQFSSGGPSWEQGHAHPLAGLNWILQSPESSTEVSPVNGPDGANRTHHSLSMPVSSAELQSQLEAWAGTSFHFDEGASAFPQAFSFAAPTPLLNGSMAGEFTSAAAAAYLDTFGGSSAAFNAMPAPFDHTTVSPTPEEPSPVPSMSTPAPTPSESQKDRKAAVTKAARRKLGPGAKEVAATLAQIQPQLSEEELTSIAIEEDKRRRNTAASARFRVKKKQREAALEDANKELQDRVTSLQKENATLRTENEWLKGLIVVKDNTHGIDNRQPDKIHLAEEDGPERE